MQFAIPQSKDLDVLSYTLFICYSTVVGDSMGGDVNQPDVVNQLSKKLGLKVVLQMENAEGQVVFEDTVSSGNTGGGSPADIPGSGKLALPSAESFNRNATS